MKVIFLDIDGVLTHTDYLNWQTRHIDPERVRFLAKIVELTDAQIVLTSTWKDGYDRQSGKKDDYYVVLEHVLAEHDLKIYDITDNIPEEVLEQIPSVISLDQLDIHCKHGTGRAAEVEKWLMDHQADGFVILDDEDHDWSDYGLTVAGYRPAGTKAACRKKMWQRRSGSCKTRRCVLNAHNEF